jgi:hypothetical protein
MDSWVLLPHKIDVSSRQIFTNDVPPIVTFRVMPADSVVELVVQQRHASFLTKAISL